MKTKFENPATQALYKSMVATVLKTVDQIDFEISEMRDLFRRLKKESETAQVLIFSAYFEDKIQDLLKLHLVGVEGKKEEERLFGSNGPLGTFSSKILMMRHLGWISAWSADYLDAWRKIRNEFAHAAYRISFSHKKIVDLWGNIKTDSSSVLSKIANERTDLKLRDEALIPEDQRRLMKLALFTAAIFHQLLVLPIAKTRSVAQDDVMSCEWNDMPEPVKQLWENAAEAIVCIAEEK